MLGAISHSKFYTRTGQRESTHSLPQAERNKAIIFLLLDTGLRASELCELKIHQVDVRNRCIMVMGKGSKERYLTKKLEFHHTPEHSSWLNMAEVEIAVLTEQCLE